MPEDRFDKAREAAVETYGNRIAYISKSGLVEIDKMVLLNEADFVLATTMAAIDKQEADALLAGDEGR